MPTTTNRSDSGNITTTNATPTDLVQIPIATYTGALMFQGYCLGVDRASPSESIALVTGQGGGVNLGVITLLPGLFGGGVQKTLSFLLGNIQIVTTGGFLTIRVTGLAGRTVDWTGTINITTIDN